MVKIRLKRMGAHKKPFYRVVVAEQELLERRENSLMKSDITIR